MTHVKICGIRRLDHALAAAEAGASMVGFVFAPSRRRVEARDARAMAAALRAEFPAVRTVGLFVNERADDMNRIVDDCAIDLIQLSGDEPDAVVRSLERPAIRTVHVRSNMTADELAARVAEAPGAMVLLDTAKAGTYGGTGEQFDWALIGTLPQRPVILAGGLTPNNVPDAVRQVRPWGVDVSSGVERDGEKSVALIRSFVRAASEVEAV